MKSKAFKQLVRSIFTEEIERKSAVGVTSLSRVPEMTADGIYNDNNKRSKMFSSDENSRDYETKESLLADLIKIVEPIDRSISVIWDDHDDIMINGRDLKYIRITPKWEDYYVIEMMTRNEDRIWVTGLSWQQVKDFVKINLTNLKKQHTSVEKDYDKSYRNREDQTSNPDKGLPQKDKLKIKPFTNKAISKEKNREKNYTESQLKNKNDSPESPMFEPKEVKRQIDYKVKSPVKLRKRKPNTVLVVKSKK